ncbi:hypothetical protein [Actinacidiphila glaucinigra]|uniref:hypothetical protein n=1 Tax=Actinacidiphila glaucinigra TaxID=235986 RepID=UPI0035DCAFCE
MVNDKGRRLELKPAPRLYLGRLGNGGYTDRLVQADETTAVTEPFPFDVDLPHLVRRTS